MTGVASGATAARFSRWESKGLIRLAGGSLGTGKWRSQAAGIAVLVDIVANPCEEATRGTELKRERLHHITSAIPVCRAL